MEGGVGCEKACQRRDQQETVILLISLVFDADVR
jgi:hypothetical protein